MPKGIYIPVEPDSPLEVREFASLEDYQEAVGGLISPVDLQDIGATIYVNDAGLIYELPFNVRATFMWWLHVPAAKNQAILVGDAVIIGFPDADGDTTDIPEDLERVLLHKGKFRLEVRVVGDDAWYASAATFDSYHETCIYGLLVLERWLTADEVRIVPLHEELEEDFGEVEVNDASGQPA
jgi:hypothetical protein